MRFALVALTIATSVALGGTGDRDSVAWIPSDGGHGWTASIARGLPATGTKTAPLTAPTSFPMLPEGKIALAGSGQLDLGSVRGKVLLIDYWASWCGPCLQELPHLQQLFESRSARGLSILAINVDEDGPTALASAKRLGLGMPIGLNNAEFNRRLGLGERIKLPTILLVDRQGRMRGRWNGYRTGDEVDIAKMADALLDPQAKEPGRSIADVVVGTDRMKALWSRDLPGTVDGVVGLPGGLASGARAVASAGGSLVALSADGSKIAQAAASSWAGRLLDFGATAEGSRRIVGFRPGAQAVGIVTLPTGETQELAIPSPIVDVAVEPGENGAPGRIAVVTTAGTLLVGADGSAAPVTGTEDVRDVVAPSGRGVLVLRADGSIAPLGGGASWTSKGNGDDHLLLAGSEGVLAGPRTAVAAAYGRFLPGRGRQLAIATYSGRLALLDGTSGAVLFDAAWPDVHDLAAIDLDGDGSDELLVAAGHAVAALAGR